MVQLVWPDYFQVILAWTN